MIRDGTNFFSLVDISILNLQFDKFTILFMSTIPIIRTF